MACAAVRERPAAISGLILLTPFNSVVATAAAHYPIFPVAALLRTRFDSEANLAAYRGPVAFFVCEKDTTIPVTLARKFYEGFRGPKRIWVEPTADHDVSGLFYSEWRHLFRWLEEEARAVRSSLP